MRGLLWLAQSSKAQRVLLGLDPHADGWLSQQQQEGTETWPWPAAGGTPSTPGTAVLRPVQIRVVQIQLGCCLQRPAASQATVCPEIAAARPKPVRPRAAAPG